MGELFSYSILSSITLTCFFFAYKALLAKEKQIILNRMLLLAIYGAALILPFWNLSLKNIAIFHGDADTDAIIEIGQPVVTILTDQESGSTVADILLLIYLSGVGLAICLTLFSLWKVCQIIRTGEKTGYGRYTVVIPKEKAIQPFSWLRYIVINRSEYTSEGKMIISHELQHIKSLHWIDLLIARLTIIIQWYNPAAWLLLRELRTIHEYEADQAVLDSGADAHTYQLLLVKKAAGARFPSLASNLNHSNLNNRITMMYKSNSSGIRRLKAFALIPAGIIALSLADNPAVASVLNSASDAELPTLTNKSSENQGSLQQTDSPKNTNSTTVIVINKDSEITQSDVLETVNDKPIIFSPPTSNIDAYNVEQAQNQMVFLVDGQDGAPDELKNIPSGNIKSIQIKKHPDGEARTIMVNMKETTDAPSQPKHELSEVMPEFPGGYKALMEFVRSNLNYPESALKDNIEGRVIIGFTITKDGIVENPQVVKSCHKVLDDEALRVVSILPAFTPGKVDGKPVSVSYHIPVNFRIPNDDNVQAGK